MSQLSVASSIRLLRNISLLVKTNSDSGRTKSTVDQLVQLTTTVSCALDMKSPCDQLFLDFSKAFDRVSHNLILESVSGWCSSNACDWIKDSISDRNIYVRVGQSQSDPLPITAGVPEGSHLGPLLFNLCINSFPDASVSSTLSLFLLTTPI